MAEYRLPFAKDPHWALWNANWDDAVAGHGDMPVWQAYAFDFGHADGGDVKAARGGKVIKVVNNVDVNVWKLADDDPDKAKYGRGSYLLIRHEDDQSVAAYCHLTKGSIAVAKDQQVTRGKSLAKSGHTGNASGPHLHFEVRSYWNSDGDQGPTIPVHFEDANHSCWRPRVGDTLDSNNS
jgi:murein DD-endopeptidase MepM/ murein hydrolase activator NlpD